MERKDLVPYLFVLTWGISTVFVLPKRILKERFLKVNRSFKKTGDKLFKILNASNAFAHKRLTFKEGN